MRQQSDVLRDLNYIKENHLKAYIFGCGMIGKDAGYDILNFLGVQAANYCDNDNAKWGQVIKEGISCVSPEILSCKDKVACFVMVSCKYEDEVVEQLKNYPNVMIITYQELLTLDAVIDRFIESCVQEDCKSENKIEHKKHSNSINPIHNKYNKKAVVYTCIVGGYDSFVEPICYSEDCDYYYISDKEPENLKVFQWIDINSIVPGDLKDNFRKNRFCKINSCHIFSEYHYSIYIDGNIQIMGNVLKYVEKIGRSGIATHRLPGEKDVYAHALHCVIAKFDKKSLIFQQMADYYKEGMPRNYGMLECTILVRDNTNPLCKKIMNNWWQEVYSRSYRDQLSFTYCLWKNGIETMDVGVLGDNYRNNIDFKRTSNHHRRNKENEMVFDAEENR